MPRHDDDPDPVLAAGIWITLIALVLFGGCSCRVSVVSGQDFSSQPDDVLWFGISHQTSQAEWQRSLRERDRLYEERWLWESQGCGLEWQAAYEDQCYRWACWDALDDALRLWPGHERKLAAIRKLRCLLGEEDYYRGIMPQAVRE